MHSIVHRLTSSRLVMRPGVPGAAACQQQQRPSPFRLPAGWHCPRPAPSAPLEINLASCCREQSGERAPGRGVCRSICICTASPTPFHPAREQALSALA